MLPRCTGTCGALATRLPSQIEERATEVEPFLDVHRLRRVPERFSHLLGNAREAVVEHFEQHGIGEHTRLLSRWFDRLGLDFVRENEAARGRPRDMPTGFDDDGLIGLDDQKRPEISDPTPISPRESTRASCHRPFV